jgi:hypothetical protein
MSHLTLYNAPSFSPTARAWLLVTCLPQPRRRQEPQSQRHRTQERVGVAPSSHAALLRLVLRTQPRSGPLRLRSAPAPKFLTVRNLITPTPRRG